MVAPASANMRRHDPPPQKLDSTEGFRNFLEPQFFPSLAQTHTRADGVDNHLSSVKVLLPLSTLLSTAS